MDGIAIRQLHWGERRPVLEVFEGLSERSRSLRFLGSKPRLLERDLVHLADVGCCGREAVAAIERETGRTVGIARFVRDAGAPEAEIAFEVVDDWQSRGLGRQLLAELREVALELARLRAEEAQAAAALGEALEDVEDGPALAVAERSEGDRVHPPMVPALRRSPGTVGRTSR